MHRIIFRCVVCPEWKSLFPDNIYLLKVNNKKIEKGVKYVQS